MKNILLFILLSVFVFASGCKRQDVKPNSIITDNTEIVNFTDEPLARKDSSVDNNLKTIYFAFDKSELTNEAKETSQKNVTYLISNPELKIILEGHTDNRGTIEYNLSLGQRRALKVKEYYVHLGIAANRIATISYGREKPVDVCNNEVAWAKNRRTETKTLMR
ncbi:MAG: peptidoglycan-associated lipoprotein Pal [Endomicrobium sp.]|jgi:peptidoglycan-associated lipoprotein|nr:peptidoglycan-associated lipoprotein Pal [Endomicrobium sp.]